MTEKGCEAADICSTCKLFKTPTERRQSQQSVQWVLDLETHQLLAPLKKAQAAGCVHNERLYLGNTALGAHKCIYYNVFGEGEWIPVKTVPNPDGLILHMPAVWCSRSSCCKQGRVAAKRVGPWATCVSRRMRCRCGSDGEHHLAAGVAGGHLVVRLGSLGQRHRQRHLQLHLAGGDEVGNLQERAMAGVTFLSRWREIIRVPSE